MSYDFPVNATSFTKGSRELYLLSGNTLTTDLQGKTKAKIWSFKAKEGNESKLDLIPAEKSDGSVGMLNLVNGEFLSVSGSGVFKHPDIVLTSGINAGKIIASGSYESGSTLSLTATPNTGYRFVRWSDGNTSTTITVTVGDSVTYSALFAQE